MEVRLIRIFFLGEVHTLATADAAADAVPLEGLQLQRSHIDKITLNILQGFRMTRGAQLLWGELDQGQDICHWNGFLADEMGVFQMSVPRVHSCDFPGRAHRFPSRWTDPG